MRNVRLLVLTAVVIALAGCGTSDADEGAPVAPAPAAEDAPRVLPGGATATPAQDAYLDAVEPHLSQEKASDILTVLQSGEDGVCGVWLHPSDPATQQQAIELLISSSGYNQTEATVIAAAAAEHLCPGK